MRDSSGPVDIRSLVDQHYELLYRYAYHLSGCVADAEDLTQETFCTAQAKLCQLRDAGSARGWLCRILRNHYLHQCRTKATLLFQSLENVTDDAEAVTETEEEFDIERLRQALGELPEAFRTPVIMFYFDEFSYRQIAQQMEVPIGTVMSRLARAKAYLRSRMRSESVISRLDRSPQRVT